MWLQDIFVPKPNNQARQLSETHFEVWDLLEKCLIKDEFDRLVLCLPRGFAKSTIVTLATVIHQAVYGKDSFKLLWVKRKRMPKTLFLTLGNNLKKTN